MLVIAWFSLQSTMITACTVVGVFSQSSAKSAIQEKNAFLQFTSLFRYFFSLNNTFMRIPVMSSTESGPCRPGIRRMPSSAERSEAG
jgi:hypothetical protein